MARMSVFVMLCGVLAACTGDPVDPETISRPDEIQSGPGLLTGEAGEYEVKI